ncbi:A-kinase anchor protein 12 [Oncorhynchus tshawytscha]|uniref:A kinase-anchoring proteins AKAP-5 and AKAP-12 calmodulin (CaM)-binding domain-containing protein n=1 Tax=Oncorhynchus tshawytscha TaxID=74940 RepID=A0A8C8GC89_ONCTS|nr:A-kinase anchor protein 12 [Oncorhynchus tshawytscha]
MIEPKEEVTPEEVAKVEREAEAPAPLVPVVDEMSPLKHFFLTGKIHKQVNQEPTKEYKVEPKDEVKEEPTEEPKTESKDEPKEEPKEEVNEKSKDKVKEKVEEEVFPTEETEAPAPTILDVEEQIISPIKKFFTTGIFAGLKKKKKLIEEEKPEYATVEKEQELQSIEKQEDINTAEEAGLEQEQTKEEISPGVEGEQNAKELQFEIAATMLAGVTDSLMAEASNVPELIKSNVPKSSGNREDVLEEQTATNILQTIISNEAELLSSGSSVQDILEDLCPSWSFVTVITNKVETNEAKLLSSQNKVKTQESLEEQSHSWGFVTVTEDVPEEEPAPVVLLTVTSNEAKLLNSQEKAKTSPVQDIIDKQSSYWGFHTVISNEAELLSSQEKAKNQGSPLRKLLSGAGLKKLTRKRRGSKPDKLTGSGEHVAEDLLSSTDSVEYQKGVSTASLPEELSAEQVNVSAQAGLSHESDDVTSDSERKKDGTWTSFKKRMTPKRHLKRSSESEDESALVGLHEEPKQSEGEQVLEHITEEPQKKVDISVSWEAFLCGSAKRRGRKTSDSEEQAPMNEGKILSEPGNTAASPLDSSQERGYEHFTSSPEQVGSPLGSEGVSTWKYLKRLITSKTKAKTEEAVKVNSPEQMQSGIEITKEKSSFSLKKLIPGRKKGKHGEKQEPISSDKADMGVGSDDEEDSETPAVVPMSEFDAEELGEKHNISTEAVIETLLHITEEETQPDVSSTFTESTIPKDTLPTEVEKAQAKYTVEQLAPSTSPTAMENFEDLMEFISKHQQLSDIPEEVSTPEEATQDDTIAEDLIELTSEAVTAPEPLDEETTEMVSAVSQLTDESPKTSGSTTPVPIEYELKDTELLLHETVDTISRTQTLSLVNRKGPHLEGISVSPQILHSPKEKEATVLIAHKKSDAVEICTGEESQQIDLVDKSPVTPMVECPSEVTEDTEESDAARITTDDLHKAEDESIIIMRIETEKDPQTELVNELEEARPELVSYINSEEGVAQVDEKVVAEETPQPDTESLDVSVTDKLISIQPLTEFTLEEEKAEFLDVAEDAADNENAPVIETITCEVQDVTAAMHNVSMSKPSDVLECLIAIVTPEVEYPEKRDPVGSLRPLEEARPVLVTTVNSEEAQVEGKDVLKTLIAVVLPEVESPEKKNPLGALRPLICSAMVQTLKVEDMVVMKNVPSAQFVDGHVIQVQVTDAELKSAEEIVEIVLEVGSSDANDHKILLQQVNAEIESDEANLKTTREVGSTDDHEIIVQVADAALKSAQVIVDKGLEMDSTNVTDHEIQLKGLDVEIESAETIVDTVLEVVLTDVKGHEIQVQVTDANAEKGSAEAIVETALEVVSSTDIIEVIDVCDKMEDEGEGENATEKIEDDMFEEASSIITQEIVQHVQQNSSEDPNVVPQSSEKAEVELSSEAEVSKSPENTPAVAVIESQGHPHVTAQVQKTIHLFENYFDLNTQGNAQEPSEKETEPSIALEVDIVCEDRKTPEAFVEPTSEFNSIPDDTVPTTFAESCSQADVQDVFGTEAEFMIYSEVDQAIDVSDSTSGHEKELVGMVVESAKESVESFENRLSIESHVHIHLHIKPRDTGVVSTGLESPPRAIWPPPSTTAEVAVNTDSLLTESIEYESTIAKSSVNTDCVLTESMESAQLCEVSQIEQTSATAPHVPLHTPPATVLYTLNPETEQVMTNAVGSNPHIEEDNDLELWLDAEEDIGTVKSNILEVLSKKTDRGVEKTMQDSGDIFDIALEPQSFLSGGDT